MEGVTLNCATLIPVSQISAFAILDNTIVVFTYAKESESSGPSEYTADGSHFNYHKILNQVKQLEKPWKIYQIVSFKIVLKYHTIA